MLFVFICRTDKLRADERARQELMQRLIDSGERERYVLSCMTFMSLCFLILLASICSR